MAAKIQMFDTDKNPPLNTQRFRLKMEVCAHYTAKKKTFFFTLDFRCVHVNYSSN